MKLIHAFFCLFVTVLVHRPSERVTLIMCYVGSTVQSGRVLP